MMANNRKRIAKNSSNTPGRKRSKVSSETKQRSSGAAESPGERSKQTGSARRNLLTELNQLPGTELVSENNNALPSTSAVIEPMPQRSVDRGRSNLKVKTRDAGFEPGFEIEVNQRDAEELCGDSSSDGELSGNLADLSDGEIVEEAETSSVSRDTEISFGRDKIKSTDLKDFMSEMVKMREELKIERESLREERQKFESRKKGQIRSEVDKAVSPQPGPSKFAEKDDQARIEKLVLDAEKCKGRIQNPPAGIKALEELWLLGDRFLAKSYPFLAERTSFTGKYPKTSFQRRFEVQQYMEARTCTNVNILSRVINMLIYAANMREKLPRFLLVILDDEFLIKIGGRANNPLINYKFVIVWLVRQIERCFTERNKKLPERARRRSLPFVMFIKPPLHEGFEDSTNYLRRAFNSALESTLHNVENFRPLYLSRAFGYKDAKLVSNAGYTDHGLQMFWQAMDEAFNIVTNPPTTTQQDNLQSTASTQKKTGAKNGGKTHWNNRL